MKIRIPEAIRSPFVIHHSQFPNQLLLYSRNYFPIYTGVVEDMIDGKHFYDQVSGYTIRQLEDVINGEMTWDDWKNNIKNSYENETEEELDALFDFWN